MRTVLFAASAALIGAVGSTVLVLDSGREAGAQTTVNVAIGDNGSTSFWYCNSSFANGICDTNIAAGDTVLWTNTGTLPHTVTECGDAFTPCPQPGGFDSGVTPLTNGQTYSQTFPAAGTYEYWCTIHGNGMRGRVIVAAAQQTPTPSPAITASPAASPTTAPTGTGATTPARTPAAAPATGGSPSEAGTNWVWLVAALGGAIVIASAVTGLAVFRRR